MLKGFKDFILRGNVIELSIAVVVGTAFTALVSAFTANIVNPILAAAGGVETHGLGFYVWPGNDKTFVNIGAVVTAFLTFLITAAVVYFIFVAPMNRINRMVKNRLKARRARGETDPGRHRAAGRDPRPAGHVWPVRNPTAAAPAPGSTRTGTRSAGPGPSRSQPPSELRTAALWRAGGPEYFDVDAPPRGPGCRGGTPCRTLAGTTSWWTNWTGILPIRPARGWTG